MAHKTNKSLNSKTQAAQALGWEDKQSGAIAPPVHLSTTYARSDNYLPLDERTYVRDHGETQSHAEALICELEGGAQALSFASGMSACTALFHCLKIGDHIAVSATIYHGVLSWLEQFAEQRGLSYDLFEAGNLAQLEDILAQKNSALVWLETPANPTWAITDISAACKLAHKFEAKVAVDSTVATPVLTRPIEHGADFVCHSATKYLNGHSDVLAGLLVTAKDECSLWQRVRNHRLYAGPMLGSFNAWLLVRGMRTLYLRVEKQSQNALQIAQFLHNHAGVEKVYYPGLANDPGHQIAQKQMQGGYGGMLSILIPGGRDEAINVALRARVFKRATSLGGVESLIEHRKTSESDITDTPENLLRISVGIEDASDLIADLEWMLG